MLQPQEIVCIVKMELALKYACTNRKNHLHMKFSPSLIAKHMLQVSEESPVGSPTVATLPDGFLFCDLYKKNSLCFVTFLW